MPINRRNYSVSAKKEMYFFVLLSTFSNFARICRISLYKGSLGNWGKSGFLPCKRPFGPSDHLETVLNSTFCYELLSMRSALPLRLSKNTWCWACNHLWLIIGCRSTFGRLLPTGRKKGNHFLWKNQIQTQLFALSLLNAFELIAASFVAPARKVRIRFRPSIEIICWFFLCFNYFTTFAHIIHNR